MHRPQFSLEVFPPRRNGPVGTIYDTLDGLEGLDPDFISVTYGHGSLADRTATARIAAAITREYRIPAVAHLTSLYADEGIVDEALTMFDDAGVCAVLALRGDPVPGREPTGRFPHASDLAAYIRSRRPDLPILGACYPEGHPDSPDLSADVDNIVRKVDAGVGHLISQLFYDDDDFYRFLELVRDRGVEVPIEAGIMPIVSASSLTRMSGRCGSRIPPRVQALLERWGDDPEALREAGIVDASEQIVDLVAHGVDGIHLYTMNRPATTRRIWRNVMPLFGTAADGSSPFHPSAVPASDPRVGEGGTEPAMERRRPRR